MAHSNSPLISIITVIKDDFLGFFITAESIQLQVSRGFEWIIVDGSSGKEVSDFVDGLDFTGVSVKYFHQKPKGIYAAMNYGLSVASGIYVWYLNAGDFLSTCQATNIVEQEFVDLKTSLAFPVLHVSPRHSLYAVSMPSILKISDLEHHAVLNHQGVLVPREIVLEAGGFDESLRLAADGKLLDFVATKYAVKICTQFLIVFTHGGASTSSHKEVWNEIDLYRTRTISNYQVRIRTFKSRIRTFFFRLENRRLPRRILSPLLNRRSYQILQRYKIQTKDLDILFKF